MAGTSNDSQAEGKPSKEHDELDPELVKLPRPKTRIRPLMAIAIVGICTILCLRLASDLSFSRLAEEPVPIGEIGEIGDEQENHYIEIEVRPDRPQAVRLVPARSSTGQVLVPVLGSGQKLWLLLPATPWGGPAGTDERYRGRLSRISDMDFHDELESYLAAGNTVPRPIPLSEVRRALASDGQQVHDAAGDAFTVSPDTFVRVDEVSVDTVRILAVSTDPYADEAGWNLALQNAGVLPSSMGPTIATPSSWTYDVPAGEGLDAIRQKLAEAKLFAARASEITSTHEGTWAELSLDGENIVLGKGQMGYQTRSIALGVVQPLPASAYLLNTTEQPGTYWYVPILFALLAGFALLFLFGLYRSLRS